MFHSNILFVQPVLFHEQEQRQEGSETGMKCLSQLQPFEVGIIVHMSAAARFTQFGVPLIGGITRQFFGAGIQNKV